MVRVMREKPNDPISFLATFLSEQNAVLQDTSRELARKQFYDLLKIPDFQKLSREEKTIL
jgi:hypothetical protein